MWDQDHPWLKSQDSQEVLGCNHHWLKSQDSQEMLDWNHQWLKSQDSQEMLGWNHQGVQGQDCEWVQDKDHPCKCEGETSHGCRTRAVVDMGPGPPMGAELGPQCNGGLGPPMGAERGPPMGTELGPSSNMGPGPPWMRYQHFQVDMGPGNSDLGLGPQAPVGSSPTNPS